MPKNDVKDFDKPLGQWVEEETPVTKNVYDPEKKRFITTSQIEKTKTMYIHAPKTKIRCKNGEHFFRVVDIHKYIFQCNKCRYARQVFPTTYKFDEKTGSLTHRVTGLRV